MSLIDGNALAVTYCEVDEKHDSAPWILSDILDFLNDAPTVDAAPVVHGYWIYHVDGLFPEESTQECSVCHEHESVTICNDRFCPNCGAKMNGGADNY